MTGDGLLAHAVRGEGEPLLLLNGGMMTYASWEPLSTRLAERYRLVLCDLRGQLLSPGRAPREPADNVADLTALLDHLEIESAHVLGTSYGGAVALLLAALAPERVRSLIAVTVGERTTDAERDGVDELRRLIAEGRRGGDLGKWHDHLASEVYSDAYYERNREELAARRAQVATLPDAWYEGVESILSAVEHLDLRPRLGAVRCPTLVIVAAADRAISPERSRALAAGIRGAEVVEHESSGHALVAEDPEWLAEVSLGFLQEQKERSDA